MERRALTILELLIAIVLIASLTALVVPAVLGRVGEFSLDAAARQVEAAFVAARAQSQREGLPVAVVARPEAGGGVGLCLEAMSASAGEEQADAPPALAPAAWTVLPTRVTLTDSAVDGERDGFAPASAGAGAERFGDGGAAQRLLVAVVLPDGTASAAGERYLAGPGGERWRLRVNRWTGAASFERVVVEEGLPADEPAEDEFGEAMFADGWGTESGERAE